MNSVWLELKYACKERPVVIALVLAFLLSAYSLTTGLLEIQAQVKEIEALQLETEVDQQYVLSRQTDAGGAAYYVHHITYDPPSSLAFTALGTRDELAWKHRLRMLALEGQIYESDPGNPELSGLGRLDFAFYVSVLLPLLLIILLYDLDARERREGRYELLSATSNAGAKTLLFKAGARASLLLAATVVPFLVAGGIAGAPIVKVAMALVVITLHVLLWLGVARFVTKRCSEGPTAATVLMGLWLLTVSAIPAAGRILIESAIPVPSGGEILLSQREAVNDAWDLPKKAIMQPFVASHPEWRDYAEVSLPFEWKWYYAFHQMADESVAQTSEALEDGITQRDELMGVVSILSPPLAADRWLTHLAETNRKGHQDYIQCVRRFHAALRTFHYPMLFGREAYSAERMIDLPKYRDCHR